MLLSSALVMYLVFIGRHPLRLKSYGYFCEALSITRTVPAFTFACVEWDMGLPILIHVDCMSCYFCTGSSMAYVRVMLCLCVHPIDDHFSYRWTVTLDCIFIPLFTLALHVCYCYCRCDMPINKSLL